MEKSVYPKEDPVVEFSKQGHANQDFSQPGAGYTQPNNNTQSTSQENRRIQYPNNVVVPNGQQQPDFNQPKDWMIPAILAAFFCSLPMGLLGIISAKESRLAKQHGDMELANIKAKRAQNMVLCAVIVGIIECLLIGGLVVRLYVLQF